MERWTVRSHAMGLPLRPGRMAGSLAAMILTVVQHESRRQMAKLMRIVRTRRSIALSRKSCRAREGTGSWV